jgi:plasmid stability protein
VDLGKCNRKHKLQQKLRIRATTFKSSAEYQAEARQTASDIAKADHKNLERSNVRDPGNKVPQAKEHEIGKSGVDATAATQGPAEQ